MLIQRHVHSTCTGKMDCRFVTVITRIEHDDLFARSYHSMDGIEQCLGSAAGDGEVSGGVNIRAVTALDLGRDGLRQGGNANHWCILIVAGTHGPIQRAHQPIRRGKIRKPLPQIDCAMLSGKLGHHGENGGSYLGEFAVQRHRINHARKIKREVYALTCAAGVPRIGNGTGGVKFKLKAAPGAALASQASMGKLTTRQPDPRPGQDVCPSPHTILAMIAPPNMPLLAVHQLAYIRGGAVVFGPLDFTLDAGQALLVQGANGAGKTTLLRVLAGLLRQHCGQIVLHGLPADSQARALALAYCGHLPALKADLSTLENLDVLCGLHGSRDTFTPEQALARAGLAGLEDTLARHLSAGQKKRLALARLQLSPAPLWLLDEPYANLDLNGIALVNHMIQAHLAQGGSTIITTHGAYAAPPVRTRVLELSTLPAGTRAVA